MDIRDKFQQKLFEARNPELKSLIKQYADHHRDAFDAYDYGNDDEGEHHEKEAEKIHAKIVKHHGAEAGEHARAAGHSEIYGTERSRSNRPDTLSGGLRANLSKNVTKGGKIPKSTQKAMKGVAASGDNVFKRKIGKPKGVIPEEQQLDELRRLSDDQKKKLQARIRDKHDKAWDKTTEIRKAKKSAGPADTKDMDKFRNRLGKIHNKLDESDEVDAAKKTDRKDKLFLRSRKMIAVSKLDRNRERNKDNRQD